MTDKQRTITVDAATVISLKARALERGLTVPQLIADLIAVDATAHSVDQEQIDELDKRWESATRPNGTTSHKDVVKWLESWGSTDFKPRYD